MALWTLILRLVLGALLALRPARCTTTKPLRSVEAALIRLLDTASYLRTLTNATLTNTRANILAVLVNRLRRSASTRPGSRSSILSKTHKTLHALSTSGVQRLVLAVIVRRETATYTLTMRMLRMVLIGTDLIVCARRMLLIVQTLTIRRLRLHAARLLGRGRRCGLRSWGTCLEHRRVLNERLGYGVARIVGRAVELILWVGVVVREGRRIALLGALASIRL